jgi:hypothetical protein
VAAIFRKGREEGFGAPSKILKNKEKLSRKTDRFGWLKGRKSPI